MGIGIFQFVLVGWFLLLPLFACGIDRSLSPQLSAEEVKILDAQIESFYRNSNPDVMGRKIPKYDVLGNGQTKRKSRKKLTSQFFNSRNQWIARRFQSKGKLQFWSSSEVSDRIEDLAETYINKSQINRNLDNLPVKGEISGDFWSGDYWNMNWGLTSYRYSSGKKFKLYKNAVGSYFQPEEWLQLVQIANLDELSKTVQFWSPAEKYDLLVGDEKFGLTREQKQEGAAVVQSNGKVEDWYGICDGWSPASIFVPKPEKTVRSLGIGGVEITWLPDDIRALASLSWTSGDYPYNLIGRRCDTLNPKTYKNGRISETDCADSNPATFHFALTNLIGIHGIPFIMDATFDAEVWNQPVLSYEIKYFNPHNPKKKSHNPKLVMVPYDEQFKKRDRFQKPLTRGYRRANQYFDGGVKAIVGVQATVVYLVEYQAEFELQPHENVTERVTYTYDLELHEQDGELIPMGGEWHENTHPDFFWVPQKSAVASTKWDLGAPRVELSNLPEQPLKELAHKASKDGYPLCSVIEALVNTSSEKGSYSCPKRY